MLFRVTDVETVPDPAVWQPGLPKWRPEPVHPAAFANLNDGRRGVYDDGGVFYVPEEPFPPAHANRLVAVAWCDVRLVNEADRPKIYAYEDSQSLCSWASPGDEADLLRAYRDAMVAEPATIVTWNGRGFDLPVMAMRALRHGIPWGWYYDKRDIRYRYTEEGHCDLMDYLSDFGAARSMKLDDACHMVGLPGKAAGGEDHFDGSQVAEVVGRGPRDKAAMARVARYCLQDVLQTALLFARTRHHLEYVDAEGYRGSVATFRDSKTVRKTLEVDWDAVSRVEGA